MKISFKKLQLQQKSETVCSDTTKMHLRLWIFLLALFLHQSQSVDIEEPKNYGPKIIPSNIPKARQALGYDKYEKQPVESSRKLGRKFYPYGNNWEQYEVPQVHYNFGFHQ